MRIDVAAVEDAVGNEFERKSLSWQRDVEMRRGEQFEKQLNLIEIGSER